jgi:hypothetical protein
VSTTQSGAGVAGWGVDGAGVAGVADFGVDGAERRGALRRFGVPGPPVAGSAGTVGAAQRDMGGLGRHA